MTEQDLLDKKKEFEQIRSELSEEKGQLRGLMQELKKWDFSSVEEADNAREEIENEIDNNNELIQNGLDELEKELDE